MCSASALPSLPAAPYRALMCCPLRCTAPAGVEKDYEQASYFSTSHPSCMFGVPADTSSIKRRLAERVHVAFPLHFSSVQPKRLPQASSGAQPPPALPPRRRPARQPHGCLSACPHTRAAQSPGRLTPPCKGVLCQERPGQAPSPRLVLCILRAPATSSRRSPQLRSTAPTQCLITFWQLGISARCLYAGFSIAGSRSNH